MKEFFNRMPPEVLREIGGIGLFIGGIILILLYLRPEGVVGSALAGGLRDLLGYGYFLLVLMLFFFGVVLLKQKELVALRVTGLVLVLVSVMGMGGLLFRFGFGLFGEALALIENILGFYAGLVLYAGLFIVGCVLIALSPILSGFARSLARPREKNGGAGELTIREMKTAKPQAKTPETGKEKPGAKEEKAAGDGKDAVVFKPLVSRRWKLPPVSLLAEDSGKPESGDLAENARIIKKTLENFGVPVEMEEVIVGPTVTQYTLKPAQGVKLSRLTVLSNDLALALAAHPIRIEAPIPGKSLVGIEVPNRKSATIRLRGLLEEVRKAGYLSVPIGRSVSGEAIVSDLAKMPHLLVAGSTGSGKSVLIHSLVLSLLFQHTPETLRFLFIDPKRVELVFYNGLPHLLADPILNSKKAVNVFRWTIQEMDRRYDLLQVHKARDIADFNAAKLKEKKPQEILPYIVLVVDELADLMQASSREIEAAITRVSQMARAVGIHMVLATQRPSVDVVTGLIKANITYRVALQVASQIDSRTILDTAGAEKLVGKGDLLYVAHEFSKPKRLQSPFVSTDEIKKVVHWWEEQGKQETSINLEEFGDDAELSGEYLDENDPLLEDALAVIRQTRKASASLMQRKLKVGYARAARILDILEARGYIGPGEGAKPREVYLSKIESESDETTDDNSDTV